MQIFIYPITILSVFISFHHHYYYEDIQRCSKPSGMYILRLRISFEQNALVALQEFLSDHSPSIMDYQAAAETYISPIINDVNIELLPFGVHIRADYGQLIMENFPFTWDKSSCRSETTVMQRVEVAHEYFERTAIHGVGNRLLIMHCPENFSTEQMWSYTAGVKQCGNILGIMYHKPDIMRTLIKDEITKIMSGSQNRTDDVNFQQFNSKLCKYMHECVSSIGNVIGEYVNNLRNAKDVTGSNFFLPVDSRTKMHGAYDDVAIQGAYHGIAREYPIDDYYCGVNEYLHLHPN
ncbi:hypothetical protein GVAV_001515 [Gurleya vavrai]